MTKAIFQGRTLTTRGIAMRISGAIAGVEERK